MSGPVKVVAALGGNALEDKGLPPTAELNAFLTGRGTAPVSDGARNEEV